MVKVYHDGVWSSARIGTRASIYNINNLEKFCPEECNIKMFADNILVYVNGEKSAELKKKMNMVFSIVEEWMSVNKLKMNASKTKYMIIRSVRKEQKGNIILRCSDGIELEREKTKYLGASMISSKISFKDHCDYMLKKIGKKTNFLNKIGNFVSAL